MNREQELLFANRDLIDQVRAVEAANRGLIERVTRVEAEKEKLRRESVDYGWLAAAIVGWLAAAVELGIVYGLTFNKWPQ